MLERDDPTSLAGRGRVSGKGSRGTNLRTQDTTRDGAETGLSVDKAYEREYLAHDRKRVKRE